MFETYRNGEYTGKFNTLAEALEEVNKDKAHQVKCFEQGWMPVFNQSQYYWDIKNYKTKSFQRITY